MKKVLAVIVVLSFILVAGIALAEEGMAKGTCMKGDSPFACAAKCIASWGKCCEKGTVEKAPAAELTDEELKIQRENTGMGMRGRIK